MINRNLISYLTSLIMIIMDLLISKKLLFSLRNALVSQKISEIKLKYKRKEVIKRNYKNILVILHKILILI